MEPAVERGAWRGAVAGCGARAANGAAAGRGPLCGEGHGE
ncbi:hypothetical protein ACP70R_043582 [Stipagrostis hirtigluma subsp. patula]